ncbi:hypothetical protein A3K73_06640 [Candidatus Pacearchaeota archaeon RBG_13_36_9]|nr:MAG: hypothetical protein A3K73_06640 [Candidatus Pacearchaeota archaeon RBG_13_36_9]
MFKELFREPPETQTQPLRQKRTPKLETAIDLEDSTTVEVCFQERWLNRNLAGPRLEGVVVYIRPTEEKTGELSGAREIVSYVFEGKSPDYLREIITAKFGYLRQRAREHPTESSWLYLFCETAGNKEIYEKIRNAITEIN